MLNLLAVAAFLGAICIFAEILAHSPAATNLKDNRGAGVSMAGGTKDSWRRNKQRSTRARSMQPYTR